MKFAYFWNETTKHIFCTFENNILKKKKKKIIFCGLE